MRRLSRFLPVLLLLLLACTPGTPEDRPAASAPPSETRSGIMAERSYPIGPMAPVPLTDPVPDELENPGAMANLPEAPEPTPLQPPATLGLVEGVDAQDWREAMAGLIVDPANPLKLDEREKSALVEMAATLSRLEQVPGSEEWQAAMWSRMESIAAFGDRAHQVASRLWAVSGADLDEVAILGKWSQAEVAGEDQGT